MNTKYPAIDITEDDLRRIIYFITMKFRGDPLHRQGTSAKRDFLGGYIERWFNKVAEKVIFDELLRDKTYKAVSDYFIYANDTEKNAPDIIGLEKSSGEVVPFVKYNNGKWADVQGMPRVEVKVFRKDQMLTGVREPQMIDDYYAFIESDLEPDYLANIFEDEVFSDRYFKELEMSDKFIESDENTQIIPHLKADKTGRIGTMRLLGIYSRAELKEKTVVCGRGVSPYYFAGATNLETKSEPKADGVLKIENNGLVNYKYAGDIYLPFSIKGTEGDLQVIKKNKGSVYVKSDNELVVDGFRVGPGVVRIEFKKFERSSSWSENVVSKYIIENYGKDSTEELVGKFGEIASS